MKNWVFNDIDGGVFESYLVVTGIPAANYRDGIATELFVNYATADGTPVHLEDTAFQSRSVMQVAQSIRESSYAPAVEKEYASKILAVTQA